MGEEEWGAISDIMAKISDESDRLGDVDLLETCISAVDECEKEKSAEERFFGLYRFLFRFYYRVRKMETSPKEFNIVYEDRRLVGHEYIDMYRVVNYDWKMYKWARKRGLSDTMTNEWLLVPVDKLTEKEKENFEKKVKK